MKKKIVFLCLASLLCLSNGALAAPFPNKTSEVIQDEGQFLQKEAKEKFFETVKKYPGSFKVVVVEGVSPEAQTADEYAQKLFDNYNLSEDTLMIVLDMETQQLGVYPGPALQAKGVKTEMLHENVTSFYEPWRNQKEYVKGIEMFIEETTNEIQRLAEGKGESKLADTAAATETQQKEEGGIGSLIPWWVYVIGLLFIGSLAAMLHLFSKRRQVLGEIDAVEDEKDQLVEKIQMIDAEKSLRRVTGLTEEHLAMIVNRKENIIKVYIPDVEMMILEADEACDKYKFQEARALLEEAKQLLATVEKELLELKEDSTKVIQTKKESKLVIPEIEKHVQQVERKLSNARLEYGLAFHEMKSGLDEIEQLRNKVKEALATGDELKAYETAVDAQNRLKEMGDFLEKIPSYLTVVRKELPNELKQLEDGIASAIGDGYDLSQDYLDNSLMQAKQLLHAAKSALEEGRGAALDNHIKAFELLMETTYQHIEQMVLANQEAAAAATAKVPEWQQAEEQKELEVTQPAFDQLEMEPVVNDSQEVEQPEVESQREHQPHLVTTPEEREILLDRKLPLHEEESEREVANEPEYEIVVSMEDTVREAAETGKSDLVEEPVQEEFVITCEEDALDELERISGALVRIRQRIKRSYLPGVPVQVKTNFEQVVQVLGAVQMTMDKRGYELADVADLLQEANHLLLETQQVAESVIATCQRAEGAIQYTNRYRKQNRQVNDLLTKAEIAFRQLDFSEALKLAEEARLVIEGEQEQPAASRWYLRRKKKGAGA